MNDINNDQLRLYDGKKLPFSEASLDGIGSELLSQDFMKVTNDTSLSRDRELNSSGNYADPLLIINNELSGQRPMTLDDVVDLDLSSLATLDNNIGSQNPQESLSFNDFLGGGFCLNSLSDKLGDSVEKSQSFGFGGANDKSGGKEFKIVPTYVDGKLTNTFHLSPVHPEPDLGNGEISNVELFPAPTSLSAQVSASDPNKVTATIEDFPSVGIGILNCHVPQIEPTAVEPDIADLIKVNPKKTKTKKVKKKVSKLSGPSEKKKKAKKIVKTADSSGQPEAAEVPKNGIPRFKIVHKSENSATSSEPPSSSASTSFSNGVSSSLSESTALVHSLPLMSSVLTQQPIELILPVITVRDERTSKPVLKPIADLHPSDVRLAGRQLSQRQKEQIATILKQRQALKRANGNSEESPKKKENKIICKVLYPEHFLQEKQKNEGGSSTEGGKEDGCSKKEEALKSTDDPKPKKAKLTTPTDPYDFEPEIPLAPSVTRSGRTSRPPKKLSKSVKIAAKKGTPPDTAAVPNETSEEPKPQNGLRPDVQEFVPVRKKRDLFLCPTCGKRYIDKKMFLKHLEKFPEHAENELATKVRGQVEASIVPNNDNLNGAGEKTDRPKRKCKCRCQSYEFCRARRLPFKKVVDSTSDKEFFQSCALRFAKGTSVWDFLLLKVKAKYLFEDYVKGVLSELGTLWETLKAVSNKILFASDQPTEGTVEVTDQLTCDALGVARGIYQTFPAELEKTLSNPDTFGDKEPDLPRQPLDLLAPDTKEDLSQSSILSDILCDKSGMDTVDQLVNERLKTLAPDEILHPPSDDLLNLLNSVQANTLSDSMFGGSNEDLLHALDHLSGVNAPLDFTALTNEFNAPDRTCTLE